MSREIWHAYRRASHTERRRVWLLAWWIGALVWLIPASVIAAEYATGPTPAWVVPVTPGSPGANQVNAGQNGVAYLLTDTQTLADKRDKVRYHRVVTTALNASGVDSVANIEIPFDPSYQMLTLHAINIVRQGRLIPKLATARIQVLQRETELETRIYDGTKTINVFLHDVRVGDTVDYSYSVSGRNPVFGGRDFRTFELQYGAPVARIHERLLLSADKHVNFLARHTTIKPVISEHGGLRDYVWNVVDAPVLTLEKNTPDWYLPFAEVDWSEFQDWAAVARWAQPLYQVPSTLSPALQVQVERIAKAEKTPAGRMLAALRLVQDEVRYLGVEIGQNSHAPTTPAIVFDRRFGDCKDKTLLTLTLLDHLGIEAHAALVNTRVQRGIAELLPTPGAFDHVIVQARVDGKLWWLDPTRYTQKADLAHLDQADFGLALIVAAQTRSLVPMRHADPTSSSRRLQVRFDASAGFDKPVRYTVQTTTEGRAAESLRASLASTNLADVQKNYLNFYANSYPHISVDAPLQVTDNEARNRIVTLETYAIADMPEPSEDKRGHVAYISMPDVVQLLRDPEVTVRQSPLELAYSQDLTQTTEVLLPDDWPITPNSTTIDDPAFRFTQTVKLKGVHLTIVQHFQGLADQVVAKDMPRYLANLARARDLAGYQLSWVDPAVKGKAVDGAAGASVLDRMNWVMALLALAMLGGCTWLARLTWRHDPPPSAASDDGLVGIGGWLLVLAFCLLVRPLVFGKTLIDLAGVMSIDNWALLTSHGSSRYNAWWAPALLYELAFSLAQTVYSVLLLILFFRRRSSFPRVLMIVLSVSIVLTVGDLLLMSRLPVERTISKDIARLVQASVGVVIWSAYLLRSQRVKATFVVRYRPTVPPPLPPVAARAESDQTVTVALANGSG